MSAALDLSRYHFRRHKGEITIYGTWCRTRDDWTPCLVLIRTGEEARDITIPCIVTLDKAWVWDEHVGNMAAAARTTAAFIDALRMSPNKRDILRVLGIIREHLGDLLRIPPYQPAEQEVIAEVTARGSDGRVLEVELTDDV